MSGIFGAELCGGILRTGKSADGSSAWCRGLWVGTYDQLTNLDDGEYCVTIDEDFTKNTYSGDTGFVQLPDGTSDPDHDQL